MNNPSPPNQSPHKFQIEATLHAHLPTSRFPPFGNHKKRTNVHIYILRADVGYHTHFVPPYHIPCIWSDFSFFIRHPTQLINPPLINFAHTTPFTPPPYSNILLLNLCLTSIYKLTSTCTSLQALWDFKASSFTPPSLPTYKPPYLFTLMRRRFIRLSSIPAVIFRTL